MGITPRLSRQLSGNTALPIYVSPYLHATRRYVTQNSGYTSGNNNATIPWSKLTNSPSSWIRDECYPEGFSWADPSKIRIGQVFKLLDHWRQREKDGLEPLLWNPSCDLLTDLGHETRCVRPQQTHSGSFQSNPGSTSSSSDTGSDEEDFGSQIAKISDKESESTREFSPKFPTLKPSCNKVRRSMTNAYPHSGTNSSTQNTSTSAASAKSIPRTSMHVYVFNNIPHSQF